MCGDQPPAREVLTIFRRGSEEVPGLIFYGLTGADVAASAPTLPPYIWPNSPDPEPLLLHGDGWRVVGWEVHLPIWQPPGEFREAIRASLQELIKVGCRVAWVGAEGIPFCDPPGLLDPACMSGGVLAWLTSGGRFDCPLDPQRPLKSASDEDLVELRRWAADPAGMSDGFWSDQYSVVEAVVDQVKTDLAREFSGLQWSKGTWWSQAVFPFRYCTSVTRGNNDDHGTVDLSIDCRRENGRLRISSDLCFSDGEYVAEGPIADHPEDADWEAWAGEQIQLAAEFFRGSMGTLKRALGRSSGRPRSEL